MTKLGFSPLRWLARRKALVATCAASMALASAAGCAKPLTIGAGGAGGVGGVDTTTTATASGATGGVGGTGGTTASSTSASSTVSSSSTSSGASASSASSTVSSSSSGAGGAGGTGGGGGGFTQPLGTPDYPPEVEQNNLKSTANPLQAGTKGFTGAVYPTGDVDVFQFTVLQGGTSATISITDGMGGCPPGAKTFMRVFDANNGVLGTDTNSGPAECSKLSPAAVPALASLAAGKYYVHVESADFNPVPFYILDISLKAPGCGDGIVQVAGGEQCDDGNNVPGDGCSPACLLENGPYLTEVESNNTQGTGNLLDGYVGAVGSISPAGDGDYFTFNVTVAGSSVTAEVGNGFNGCPSGFDSKMYLYSPSSALLVSDDDGGVSPCSKISPAQYPAATNLPVGLYAIKVERYGNTQTSPFYVLKLHVAAPGCGDNILQTGEQCDDGNTASGDGCSSTCTFEKNFVPETEVNDTQALGNLLPASTDGFVGSINPAGDVDYFKINVPAGASIIARTSDGVNGCPAGFDSKITLFNPGGTQLAVDDDGGVAPCSKISPAQYAAAANLPAGTYTVKVERVGGALTQAQYVLELAFKNPGCGDSVLQAAEQCDDGNNSSGDGCSATCMVEAPYEIEHNDTQATANAQWAGFSTWKGAISPVGDHDYFTFTLAAPGSVTLLTHDANSPGTCGFDTVIHLLDHLGTQIAQDDDNGPGSCSLISPALYPAAANLPAAQYYVWVQRYTDSQVIPLYQLDLTVQ